MDDTWRSKLLAWHAEELADAQKYRDAAAAFPHYAGILCDMSDEESTHARHIKWLLDHD